MYIINGQRHAPTDPRLLVTMPDSRTCCVGCISFRSILKGVLLVGGNQVSGKSHRNKVTVLSMTKSQEIKS